MISAEADGSDDGRLLVGLTGGLAAGKSSVARLLREAGCTVVDADQLVAELYRPGAAGATVVAELFGTGVLDAGGGVDRRHLATAVFTDSEARRRLEMAIHPLVRRRFRDLADASCGIVVLEATLLVEAGYGPDFDIVVSVEAQEEVRLARAVARGMDPEDARRRLTAQGDGGERLAGATRVLRNDGDQSQLLESVRQLLAELRARL